MIQPRYQDISSSKIPITTNPSDERVRVRVIAGESMGTHAIIDTRTSIMYLHITLKSGAELMQPVPINYNIFAYIINEGLFGKNNLPAQRGKMVIFENDGNQVVVKKRIESEDDMEKSDLDLLLITGLP